MSTPPPPLPVHELETSPVGPFWTKGDASSRRVFIVPVIPPTAFVAFGTLWPADKVEVLFVAKGQVDEHLGAFIAQMEREGSHVELCVRPPLPLNLVDQYADVPPFEGYEYDPPPGTPVRGASANNGIQDYSRLRDATLWTSGDVTSRYTYLTPLNDSSEFLALGVTKPFTDVVFAARGTLTGDLSALIEHALREQSYVELYPKPPLPDTVLGNYLAPPGSTTSP